MKNEREWQSMLARTKVWIERYGPLYTPPSRGPHRSLSLLWSVQRRANSTGKLPEDRRELLREVGFLFEGYPRKHVTDHLGVRILQCQEFLRAHGHLRIPQELSVPVGLGQWVSRMRRRAKYNPDHWSMSVVRQDLPGFVWVSLDPRVNRDAARERWLRNYALVKQRYFRVHGHCNIPNGWYDPDAKPGDSRLDIWIYKQRAAYRNGELSRVQVRLLNRLRIDWCPPFCRWSPEERHGQ